MVLVFEFIRLRFGLVTFSSMKEELESKSLNAFLLRARLPSFEYTT